MTLRPGNHWTENALYLARASLAAYRTRKRVEKSKPYQKLKLGASTMIVTDNDAALIGSDERNVVVAFRGTDKASDWKGNAGLKLRQVPGGRVHAGLHTVMKKLLGGVREAMKTNKVRSKDLWFTGHSRGGAIAVLMAQHLAETEGTRNPHHVPDFVYTFGARRVGDLTYYQNYDLREQTTLVINKHDPVPQVPPVHLTDYYHVAKQWRLNNFSVSRLDVDLVMGKVWDNIFSGAWRKFRNLGIDIKDHDLAKGYIPNLLANQVTPP